jgi:hypothetical protein
MRPGERDSQRAHDSQGVNTMEPIVISSTRSPGQVMEDLAPHTEVPGHKGKRITLFLCLGFLLLANSWGCFRIWTIIDDFVRHDDPNFNGALKWALPVSVVLCATTIVAVILLFARRRLGLWIFVVAGIAAFAVNLIIGGLNLVTLMPLVWASVIYYLVRLNADWYESGTSQAV